MSEELVKRLRDAFAYESRHYMPDRLYNEAADTIEALQKWHAVAAEELNAAEARITQLEAELAGAREALRPFADCCEQIAADESDEEWAKFRLLIGNYRAARAALAQERTDD